MGPEDILNGKSWVCGTQKRRSQTHVILSEHSGWQGNILEFLSSSQLLKNVPTEPLHLISLRLGQPRSPVHGMSRPSQTDQKIVYPREGDA